MNRFLVAVALALPFSAAGQMGHGLPDLERGRLASFPLDGDAVDEVTGTRASPVATRPADDRHGNRNGALWFDGARSAVNLGDGIQPARFTVSAWIRPESVDRVGVILSKIRNLPGHWQKNFELRLNQGGRLFLHVPSGQGWEGVEGARAVAPRRWTHVAAVYDGARAQLYVDGLPDGAPLGARYEQSHTDTWIGARPEAGGRDGRVPSGPAWFFQGAIDEVQVWDRPLSQAELAFVSGRAPPPPEPPRPPSAGPPPGLPAVPIAAYPLDGDARDALGGGAGTLAGTRPAEDRGGNPRGALAFGGRDHVDLGARVEPEQLSIAVWVRPTRAGKEQVILSKLSSPPRDRERWLELKADAFGRIVFTLPNGSPFASSVRTERRLASGRWTHVAATYDGDRALLYVDGAPAGQARVDPFESSRGPVFLGARPDAQGKRARLAPLFDGRMDDLRVFRGALLPDEVAQLARTEDRPRPRPGGDDDDVDHLLVKVGRLLVRYDAACVRGDPEQIARVEERIGRELEEAARAARGDRELAERLRHVARELERGRGHDDAMSLDRKRTALAALHESLWNDHARDMDDRRRPYGAEARPPGQREGW